MTSQAGLPAFRSRAGSILAGPAFAVIVLSAITLLLKVPTLNTPAFWDEMGWLRQAAWLSERNLLEALPGLRPASAFWGHPPGLHLLLAAGGKVFGVSVTTAHVLIAGFAALGVAGTFLLARQLFGTAAGWVAALSLLLSPLYLAQSGMFLADVPITALGALALYFALGNRYAPWAVCASAMVLLKETAIALVVALLVYRFAVAAPLRRASLREIVKWSVPLGIIGAFFVLQRITTGEFFFIYEFDVELVHLTPARVRRVAELITAWLFMEQGRVVFTLILALALLVHPALRRRRELWLVALVVALSGYSFSVLYFLPRYLLPVLPLFFAFASGALFLLVRQPVARAVAAGGLLALSLRSLGRQPMDGNGEKSLRYLDIVAMHQAAASRIARDFPGARVLTTWPHTAELSQPLQRYVTRPLDVREFRTPADLEGADLILVSHPADGTDTLRALAVRDRWRLVVREENESAWLELYAGPHRMPP